MELPPGKETSEYRMTQITLLVNSVVALAVMYGVISEDAGPLWAQVILIMVALALPVAATLIARDYNAGRLMLKLEPRPEDEDENVYFDQLGNQITHIDEVPGSGNIFQPTEEA